MTKQTYAYCEECGERGRISEMDTMELYDHPFDETSWTAYFHKKIPAKHKNDGYMRYYDGCREGFFDRGSGEFGYFDCIECGRTICEQNPQNGWMTQFRYWDESASDNDDKMCLKCFEERILKDGVPREKFERGYLEGMFFSYDNHEPIDAGYKIDERVHNRKVSGDTEAKEIREMAKNYIDSGHKVIIGYESMAIGGGEGYITLFHKGDSASGRVD